MLITLHPLPLVRRPFDDVMRTALGTSTRVDAFRPAIDVSSDDDGVVLVCDVPGIPREELSITVEQHTLTVEGTRRFDTDQGEQVLLGRSYGAFRRSFTLADDVDVDGLRAELDAGVLTIRVPTKPQPTPRKIAIGAPAEAKRMGG